MGNRHTRRRQVALAGKYDALRHQIEYVDIATLRPNPRNARVHSNKQLEHIDRSMKRRGFVNPMLVKNNIVYVGNARLAVAEKRGLKLVPIIRVDHLSDVEIRAFALEDNNLSDLSEFDRAILADEINSLLEASTEGFDLIASFDPVDTDNLLSDLVDPEHDPADDVPEPETIVVSRLGDDWQFGESYLRCGDAKSEDDMRALMRGRKATVGASDPPYNLATSFFQGRGKIRHGNFLENYGENSPDEFTRTLTAAFRLAAKHTIDGALLYYFGDWRHCVEYITAGKSVFPEFKNLLVWDKIVAGMGSHYRSQHELLFLFKNGTAPHINNIDSGRRGVRSNIFRHQGANTFRKDRQEEAKLHPTIKPVGLLVDILKDASRRGDIVLDQFAGSGSIFLAAERVGRRAYGMEIDPKFVDVAIRRWQSYTGRDAILCATGETFDEVAESRTSPARPARIRLRR